MVHGFLLHKLQATFIDAIAIPDARRDAKKADFLLFERGVVVEIKGVEDDRLDKIHRIIESERQLRDWPPTPPGAWLQDVLARHPRGEEINARLRDMNRRMTEKLVKDANRQIRDTRVTFSLPSSIGLLLVVNEDIDVLDPRVLGVSLHELMMKRTSLGAIRFPDIDMAMLITSAHSILDAKGERHPCIFSVIRPDDARTDQLREVGNRVMKAWAEALGLPLDDWGTLSSPDQVRDLRFDGRQPPAEI